VAVCRFCNQEMLTRVSCTLTKLEFPSGTLERVPFGDEPNPWGLEPLPNCHDCGVPLGAFHHPGCDCERCACCGKQFLSCCCATVGPFDTFLALEEIRSPVRAVALGLVRLPYEEED
jgi:hypothetical protein